MVGAMIGLLLAAGASSSAAVAAFDAADIRLNAAYRVLMIHQFDYNKASFRDSEREWIGRRDRQCGADRRNACATRLTIRRANELEALLPSVDWYGSVPDGRLASMSRVLDESCALPGQAAGGAICRRRNAARAELRRRRLARHVDPS